MAGAGCSELAGLGDYGRARSAGGGGSDTSAGGSGGAAGGAMPSGGGGQGGTTAGSATGGGGQAITTYCDAVVATKPMAYRRLGEVDKKSDALDEIGGSSGEYVGAPSLVAGLVGDTDGATQFNGDDRVRVFNFPTEQLAADTDGFTVELWYEADVTGLMNLVVLEPTFVLSVEPGTAVGTHRVVFTMRDASTSNDVPVASPDAPAAGRHYVWASWSPSMPPVVSLDGMSSASGVGPVTFDTTTEPLYFGGLTTIPDAQFAGVLDEVAIYDFAFDPLTDPHFEDASRR